MRREKRSGNFRSAAGGDENIVAAKTNAHELMTKFWEMVGWRMEVVFDDER